MPTNTTAQLREEAAHLYGEAADAYPTQKGALAAADIASLRRSASTCRSMLEGVAA